MVGATLAELLGSFRLRFFSLAEDREKKQVEVDSSNTDTGEKAAAPMGRPLFLELLGRFELPQRIALKRYSL